MGESPSHVRHLTKQALRDFLSAETQGKHGMLQRFLPPLGGHNALLRISRTPHHLGLECRRNWHATADNRVELAARLATFEGEVRHVGPAVLGTHLMEEAKEAARGVVRAIDEMYEEEKLKVWRITLNFKLDGESQLHLISCNRMSLAETDEDGLFVGMYKQVVEEEREWGREEERDEVWREEGPQEAIVKIEREILREVGGTLFAIDKIRLEIDMRRRGGGEIRREIRTGRGWALAT
ncbi:MAG: hypothetical protein SGPRY_012505 [Prymnesium sp.]